MSKHLKNDLERLEKRLLGLGARVEEAVRRALSALQNRRTDQALDVVRADIEIDREEVEIEEECLKILALHQPVASDLRFVAACLKINNDLERIGDLAVNIAERVAALDRETAFPAPVAIPPMTEQATAMLRESLDSFVKSDVALARDILVRDDEVDRLHTEVIGEMIEYMKRNPERVDDALLFISTSRNLERIADHATNIAEDVIYLVEGAIVRHQEPE